MSFIASFPDHFSRISSLRCGTTKKSKAPCASCRWKCPRLTTAARKNRCRDVYVGDTPPAITILPDARPALKDSASFGSRS